MSKFISIALRGLLSMLIVVAVCDGACASVIPVTKFRSADMPGGTPAGWVLDKKVGTPSLKIEKDGANFYMHLLSRGNTSFGLRTSARVNVKDFPIISSAAYP